MIYLVIVNGQVTHEAMEEPVARAHAEAAAINGAIARVATVIAECRAEPKWEEVG